MQSEAIVPVSPNKALLFEDPFTRFDLIGERVDDERESEEIERAIAEQSLAHRDGPYRSERVTVYLARAGVRTRCPECEDGEGRVDGWGAFHCENCGYSNTTERPRRSVHDGEEALG